MFRGTEVNVKDRMEQDGKEDRDFKEEKIISLN